MLFRSEKGFRESVATLASDAFEGRKPGQAGEERTLAWIEGQYRALGLKPGLPDGYRQPVNLVEIKADPSARLEVEGHGGSLSMAYAEDTVVWTRRVRDSAALAHSPLVFVGHGIHAPEYGWNDYEGVDMHGKTAVILVNDPGYRDPALFRGKNMTYYGRWVYKYEEAVRRGALGMLIVHETAGAAYGWNTVVASNGESYDVVRPDPAKDKQLIAAADILRGVKKASNFTQPEKKAN